jgi:hypothetical protein
MVAKARTWLANAARCAQAARMASSLCWSVSVMLSGSVMIQLTTRRTEGGFRGGGWILVAARN